MRGRKTDDEGEETEVDLTRWLPAIGSATSALVALIGGIVSVVFWLRSRGEREEAERQAKAAAESASTVATATRELTDLRIEQDRRDREAKAVEERDPWDLRAVSSAQAELTNASRTAKYGVEMKLVTGQQMFTRDEVGFVGPGRSAKVSYISFGNADVTAIITWHLQEDLQDSEQRQEISW